MPLEIQIHKILSGYSQIPYSFSLSTAGTQADINSTSISLEGSIRDLSWPQMKAMSCLPSAQTLVFCISDIKHHQRQEPAPVLLWAWPRSEPVTPDQRSHAGVWPRASAERHAAGGGWKLQKIRNCLNNSRQIAGESRVWQSGRLIQPRRSDTDAQIQALRYRRSEQQARSNLPNRQK